MNCGAADLAAVLLPALLNRRLSYRGLPYQCQQGQTPSPSLFSLPDIFFFSFRVFVCCFLRKQRSSPSSNRALLFLYVSLRLLFGVA